MDCRECGENRAVFCSGCARQTRDRYYERGLSHGREDGLEDGIRLCAVEVDGALCVNGVPLVEVLARAMAKS